MVHSKVMLVIMGIYDDETKELIRTTTEISLPEGDLGTMVLTRAALNLATQANQRWEEDLVRESE
jgi:hypothetical protein